MTLVPAELIGFLGAPSPAAWVRAAVRDVDTLLKDHAACELKAASTALSTLRRYPKHRDLARRMSRLAREELRHFEQVLTLLTRRGSSFQPVSAAGYAAGLRIHIRESEPDRLVDSLVVGAFIEARSCERFALLVDELGQEPEVAGLYAGLLDSEARHFQVYLKLAENAAGIDELDSRIREFRDVENALILQPGNRVRFHSGPPVHETRAA